MTDDGDEDVPEWASTMFWALVLVFNIALFFTAVGVMVVYFESDWSLGGAMLAVGVVSWAVGIGVYSWTRDRLYN